LARLEKSGREEIMKHARAIALTFIAAWALTPAASAQTYPNRPITLVVPFPAGGATDAIARMIQDSMSETLGQQVVIENVGGAGGMIGAARVARAQPDGYTLLLHQVAMAAGVTLYPKLAFEAEKDFSPIGVVNISASTIAVRASLPASNMAELVRWMKEPGQNAKIAHAGVGSFGHLCGVLFAQEIGAPATQVPYRGGGPALNDLVAGHADLSCLSAAITAPLVNNGNLKVYGIVGRNRFAGLPGIPTMSQAGYKNLDLDFWHILFAPAGTPQPAVDKLNAALRRTLGDAKVKEAFDKGGMELFPADQQTAEAASAMLKTEIKRWGDVIRANNIQAQ
jgi:tripartite-type tricarboxylate transporter receptor subunit TctC